MAIDDPQVSVVFQWILPDISEKLELNSLAVDPNGLLNTMQGEGNSFYSRRNVICDTRRRDLSIK